jgi:para-nitrobenzyl esterase
MTNFDITAALVAVGLALAVPPPPAGGSTVVTTGSGRVSGVIADGLRVFEGIPYAAPPVGDLRWKAPRPVTPWSGTKAATEPGDPCAQPAGLPVGVPSESEDCLYLNVATPAKSPAERRPVLVWIHGGSLMFGSGDRYGPGSLATAGPVVVSINYRLGIFGHLSDPSQPGADGLSLQDQQAALRWVRANATAFGGDPGNVTIMGQSGGGYSVCDHLVSPASAGLFHRAVVQSAPCAAGGSRSRAEAAADARRVISAVRCERDTARCLRDTPVSELLAAYGPDNEPRPVHGTALLPRSPAEALRTGRFHRVPVLIGVNKDEERGRAIGEEMARGGPLPPAGYEPAIRAEFGAAAGAVLARYPLAAFGSAGEALAAVRTDAIWSVPTLATARLLSAWTTTLMYEFSERDTPWFAGYPRPSFDQRAGHMTELPYLFDDIALFEPVATAQTAFRDRMVGTWTRFAATGATGWPAFRGRDGHVRALASDAWRRTDFAAEHHYGFWTGLNQYGFWTGLN